MLFNLYGIVQHAMMKRGRAFVVQGIEAFYPAISGDLGHDMYLPRSCGSLHKACNGVAPFTRRRWRRTPCGRSAGGDVPRFAAQGAMQGAFGPHKGSQPHGGLGNHLTIAIPTAMAPPSSAVV